MKRLIGNEEAGKALLRLIAKGRVPNALLFSGPEGVGKKQFALELARSLICHSQDSHEACGECPACIRAGEFSIPAFEKGEDSEKVFFSSHPDVGLILPYRRNLRVGAIRALELEANYRPYEASSRFFIVENAEKMNDAAANALLKTLEEPPSTSHIILITSKADALLPTICSRCQTIRFGPVAFADIANHLVTTGNFSPKDAALAARVSGGSIGRALQIVPASFRTQRSQMLEVLKAAVAGDKSELLAVSEEINDAKNKDEYEEKLRVLQTLIHDIWLIKNSAGEILNSDIEPELARLAEMTRSKTLASWLQEIEALIETFIVNINRRIATDSLFIRMAAG